VTTRRAIVVGGGIGGLAAAIALHRQAWDVTVLERAEHTGEVGAGISLWPNALAALDALRVWPDIRSSAAMQVGGARLPDGRWLARADPGRPPPVEIVLVHRTELHGHLLAALPAGTVRAGCEVTAVTADGRVTFAGDETAEVDLVVAADGVRSTVRAALWPDRAGPRYAGFTAWRGVTREPSSLDAAAETWGRGSEFGATILHDGRVYWFATANRPEGERSPDEHAELQHLFGSWHEPIGDILAATDPAAVLRHDIYDLTTPLPNFVNGRVVLLGDAAHAMTPNLGQGACQALEDAVTLGALLGRASVATGLAEYDRLRRPRTERFVRRSARVGRMLQSEGSATIALRNLGARLAPQRLAARAVQRTVAWHPPR
jgi:2-polyprenyl-6-methoxyphenol hydroxylase-like FAD-dependent oxidoreductase